MEFIQYIGAKTEGEGAKKKKKGSHKNGKQNIRVNNNQPGMGSMNH